MSKNKQKKENEFRNPDGTFKKGVSRPEPVKGGRKKLTLEDEQYEEIKEVVAEYIKLAKKLYKGKVKDAEKIKKDKVLDKVKDWMENSSHSGLYLHKKKKGYEYHYNPELQAYLKEKLQTGNKFIDKVHPQKSSQRVSYDIEEIEKGLNKLKEAIIIDSDKVIEQANIQELKEPTK